MSRSLITIDPEFKNLIPALSPEEFKQLEQNILANGCREPLCVWKTDSKTILVDGHNRHAICTRHDRPFKTKVLTFPDRDHVKLWIGEQQLGRRNLTDDQRAVAANDVRGVLSEIANVMRILMGPLTLWPHRTGRASGAKRSPENALLRCPGDMPEKTGKVDDAKYPRDREQGHSARM